MTLSRVNTFFSSSYPWLIVTCGMLYYCFNYFLRVSPSVMQPELTSAFHITAAQFGTLAGFYYFAYTPMQVPAGMIFDRFGVRFVLFSACLIAVSGLNLFLAAHDLHTAEIGRFLIGLGCAFAYIGTLKLASLWLPANRFATVAGLTTAFGMISGAASQKYLTKLVETVGYQSALHSAIFMGFSLSALIVLIVRSRPLKPHQMQIDHTPVNFSELFNAVTAIFKNKQMWLIGIIGCLLYLPSSVFLDLWGVSYLKTVYNLTSEEAVKITGITFYGWIISGPIIGMISDKIKRRCIPLTLTGLFAAILLCVVFYVPNINPNNLGIIFFMIGFCCGAHPLCFALGKENNPIQIASTAVAVTNMLIMAGGVIFQPVVGKLLMMHASGAVGTDGLPLYTPGDYTFALSVVPVGVALGIFLSIFLKETYCRSESISHDAKPIFANDTILEKPLAAPANP